MQEWTYRHGVARLDNAGVDKAGALKQVRQVEMCAHTAALNDHLLGDSDDDDDGADEDAAQTTDQTPPQEPATRASDDCCEVCLNRKYPPIALVPCGHQRFCESCAETVHQRGDRCPLCRAVILRINDSVLML